ncbi:hypothetical protein FLA_3334 [Filimonas lacunae]|nr:hypothetical protein FLA_3334 [Filimonas lacunae]
MGMCMCGDIGIVVQFKSKEKIRVKKKPSFTGKEGFDIGLLFIVLNGWLR